MNEHIERGRVLIQQHRADLAEGELRLGLAQDPQDAWGHVLLSTCLRISKRPAEALDEARRAIHVDPEMPLAHYCHARALDDLERFDEAHAAIDEAIRLDPLDADYHSAKGGLFYQQRSWADARRCAERGLAQDPENVDCHNLLSLSLVKLGLKTEAVDAARQALARAPENAGAHAVQGWNYLEQGLPDQALEHFREALRLDPTLEAARSGMVEAMKARYLLYRWMLRYFLWMGKLSGAAQWGVIIGLVVGSRILRAVLDANPSLAPVLVPLALLYFAFFYMSWVADPLSNLLLRLSKFGRYALSVEEVRATNWFGAFLALALAGALAGAVTHDMRAVLFAAWAASMTIPAAIAFRPENRRSRSLPILAVTLGLVGLGALVSYSIVGAEISPTDTLFTIYLLGWVGITWFGNTRWFKEH